MDSARFDGLVRRFGQTRSRRQTLGGLAALSASGGLALLGLGEAQAVFPKKCTNTAQCGPGATCKKKPGKKKGKCLCLPGLTSCPGTLGCVNTQTDNNNCGPSCTQCPA